MATAEIDVEFIPQLNKAKNALKKFESEASSGMGNAGKQGGSMFGGSFMGAVSAIGIGTAIGSIVADGVKLATEAVVGFAKSSVTTFAGFEAEMLNVRALTGSTGEQFEKLEQQALELGKTTFFSASEAAAGQGFLAQAGFETTQILEAMPDVLALAQAGNLDLARSADIASNIMGQFGIQAKDTSRVTNLLAATASSSNTNVEQLSEAMKYLGPTAESLGISIEETAGIIGVLGDAGIQGSMAGRALGSSLVRLTKPTKEMEKVINGLGLQFFDTEGNMKSMSGIIAELEEKTGKLTEKQRAAAFGTLFGAEAYQEINILLNRGSKGLADYTKEITGTNKAQEIQAIRSQGVAGAFKAFTSAVESAQIALMKVSVGGKELNEWLAIATANATELIRNADFQTFFDTIASGIERVSPIFQPFFDYIQQWFSGGGSQSINNFVQNTWTILENAFDYFTFQIVPLLQTTMQNFLSFFNEQLAPRIEGIWTRISTEVLPRIMPFLKSFVEFFNTVLWPVIKVVLTNLLANFDFTWNMVITLINLVLDVLDGLMTFFTGVFQGDMEKAGKGIEKIFSGIGTAIRDMAEGAINFAIGKINSLIEAINNVPGIDIGKIGSVDLGRGFATGGYTGRGNPRDVAGFVHKNEFVLNSGIVDKVGLGNIQALVSALEGANSIDNRDMSTNNTSNYYGLQTASSFF